jgi:hypothetical protein
MTAFFVPGTAPGGHAERAYDELRAGAQARTARRIRATRIHAVSCRRGGTDSSLRVGECDPSGGGTVHAIFATSDGYTVVCGEGYVDLSRRQIYEAIPFD